MAVTEVIAVASKPTPGPWTSICHICGYKKKKEKVLPPGLMKWGGGLKRGQNLDFKPQSSFCVNATNNQHNYMQRPCLWGLARLSSSLRQKWGPNYITGINCHSLKDLKNHSLTSYAYMYTLTQQTVIKDLLYAKCQNKKMLSEPWSPWSLPMW